MIENTDHQTNNVDVLNCKSGKNSTLFSEHLRSRQLNIIKKKNTKIRTDT